MFLRILVTAFFICFVSANTLFAQESAIKCLDKTEYVKAKVSPLVAKKPNYPQFEEYCQKKVEKGFIFKEGSYILWGPNGEKLEEGQYVNGKKDGKWERWLPSQILEDSWKEGEFIDSKVIGSPPIYVIDFGACNEHEYGIPAALGSTSYQVLGKEGDYCKLNYSIEIEMSIDVGKRPYSSCLVPTIKKKLSFGNTQLGIDFSSIKQYCKWK